MLIIMKEKDLKTQCTSNYEHLKERYLNIDLYSCIMVFDDVIIFPLWNLSGQMIGYQQYRPGADKKQKNDPREGKYYTSLHGDKNEKPLAMWGLESYSYRSNVLILTEGIFDACRMHNNGIPAVALLTGSYKHFRNWLYCQPRKIFKVDDDHASQLGPYENLDLPEGRSDLGECSSAEVKDIINKHILPT